MTFLFPGFLLAAGAVSLGVVVLHFLITQQPKSEHLPTVRFVPDVPARSTSLAIKPSDLLLLLLRVVAIMLIGAAFAQPRLTPTHQDVARIVIVDASRSVGNVAELVDSAASYAADASAVVFVDSVAYEVEPQFVADSLQSLSNRSGSVRRSSLSPALITAMRAASRIRESADSIELVVVSPFVNESRDAATSTLRELWPGRITTVHVAAASLADAGALPAEIVWVDSAQSGLWSAREVEDTVGAVRAGDVVLVSRFVRKWKAAEVLDTNTRVFARWLDGEPAAFETLGAAGCVRTMALDMPTGGDVAMRPDYVRLQEKLAEPCGITRDFVPLSDDAMSEISGPVNLASAESIQPRITKMTPLVPWLLLGALVLALLELWLRRRTEQGAERRDQELADKLNTTKPVTQEKAA